MNYSKNEMTLERKQFLSKLMAWYWLNGNPHNLISKSDYEFIYDIYDAGLSFYNEDVQTRLNGIRTIYLNDIKNDKGI